MNVMSTSTIVFSIGSVQAPHDCSSGNEIWSVHGKKEGAGLWGIIRDSSILTGDAETMREGTDPRAEEREDQWDSAIDSKGH